MNNFDGIEEPVVVSSVGKKRKPSKDNHEREVRKRVRNSGGGKIPAIACSHSESKNFCHADKLTADDLVKNFDTLLHTESEFLLMKWICSILGKNVLWIYCILEKKNFFV